MRAITPIFVVFGLISLSASGIFAQWIALYQVGLEDFLLIADSFASGDRASTTPQMISSRPWTNLRRLLRLARVRDDMRRAI